MWFPRCSPARKKAGLFSIVGHSHSFGVGLPALLGAPAPLHSQAQALPLFISGETSLEDTPDLTGSLFLQGHSGFCQNWGGGQNTLKCKVSDATKRPPPLWTPWGPSDLSFPPSRDSKTDGGGALRLLGQQEEKGTDGGSRQEARRRGPKPPDRGGAGLSNWPEAPACSCGPELSPEEAHPP